MKTKSTKRFQFHPFQSGRAALAAMLFPFAALWAMTGQTVGAQTTGFNQTGAGPYDYTNAANWVGGTVNGIWSSGLTLTADQTVTFAADASIPGLFFTNAGNYAITLKSTNSTPRLLTMNGSIIVASNSTSAGVTIGDSVNHLNVRQYGNYFTYVAGGRKLTLQDVVSGDAAQPVTKDWPGTLALLGLNTFAGDLTVLQGTVSVNTLRDFGIACSVGQQAAGSNIKLSSSAGAGTLEYVGAGDTANRTVRIGDTTAGDTYGGTILNNGTGALTLSATNFNPAISGITVTRILTLGGTYAGAANTISGIIQDNNGTAGKVALTKAADNSSWTLSGANTYSSGTIVSGGTLKVDAGAGGSLNSTSTLTLGSPGFGGGTFIYDNTNPAGAKSQALGALTSSAGANTVQINRTAAQPILLTFASNTRTAGSTENFVYDNAAGGGTLGTDYGIKISGTPSGTILSGGAFLNGADFALWDNSTYSGYLRAPAYGTDSGFVTVAGGTSTLGSGSHNLLTGSDTNQGNVTISTLKVGGGNSISITFTNNGVLTCPAILVTGGSTLTTIGGTGTTGIACPTANGEIVVRTDTASDIANLGVILNNTATRVIKTGAGTLMLKNSNTYQGATTVNQGTLLVNGTTHTNSAVTVMKGATLGGFGTINGPVTVNPGGTIQPSISGATNNLTLSTNAAPVFNAGSILKVRAPASTTVDKLTLSTATTLNIAGMDLVIDVTGLSGSVSSTAFVQLGGASPVITGPFRSVTVTGGLYTPALDYSVAGQVKLALAPTPTISTSGTLSALSTTNGTASSATSFNVSGVNLTGFPGNLTVTPPGGYEVSLSSGSGYTASLSVPYSSATLAGTTVYVRLAASTLPGSYSGNISISGGGAAAVNVATVTSTVSPVNSQPVINQVAVSAGSLILQGTNGTPSGTYSILTSTNIALPLSGWTTNITGVFGAGGGFSNAIPLGSEPGRFFQIKTP